MEVFESWYKSADKIYVKDKDSAAEAWVAALTWLYHCGGEFNEVRPDIEDELGDNL